MPLYVSYLYIFNNFKYTYLKYFINFSGNLSYWCCNHLVILSIYLNIYIAITTSQTLKNIKLFNIVLSVGFLIMLFGFFVYFALVDCGEFIFSARWNSYGLRNASIPPLEFCVYFCQIFKENIGLESIYILSFQFGFHGEHEKSRFGSYICIKHKTKILTSQV